MIPLFYTFMSDCQENYSRGKARFSLVYNLFKAALEKWWVKFGLRAGSNLVRLCKQATHSLAFDSIRL